MVHSLQIRLRSLRLWWVSEARALQKQFSRFATPWLLLQQAGSGYKFAALSSRYLGPWLTVVTVFVVNVSSVDEIPTSASSAKSPVDRQRKTRNSFRIRYGTIKKHWNFPYANMKWLVWQWENTMSPRFQNVTNRKHWDIGSTIPLESFPYVFFKSTLIRQKFQLFSLQAMEKRFLMIHQPKNFRTFK